MRCDPELSVDLRTAQWLDWPAGTGGTADVRLPSKNDSSWPGRASAGVKVRRPKPATQADWGWPRLLKSKCNHDRQQLAALSPSPVMRQGPTAPERLDPTRCYPSAFSKAVIG